MGGTGNNLWTSKTEGPSLIYRNVQGHLSSGSEEGGDRINNHNVRHKSLTLTLLTNVVWLHFDLLFCSIQVCDDIDECNEPNNGGCAENSQCHNSVVKRDFKLFFWINICCWKNPDVYQPAPAQGSYHCGSCKTGFTGDQVKGCKPEISCGNSLTNPCDANAQCVVERDGSISCQVGLCTSCSLTYSVFVWVSEGFLLPSQCGIGWAGNGYLCGKDTDIDGYPDEKLRCKDTNCRKVSKPQFHFHRQGSFFLRRSNVSTSLLRITVSMFRTLAKRMLIGMVKVTPVMMMQMVTVY